MPRGPFPSDKQDQFMVRFPEGMRDQLKAEAAKNNRSMNAEIVARLEGFPEIRARLFAVSQENARLKDDIDRLEMQLAQLSELRERFIDDDGSPKPVITIPRPLLDRIRLAAERNFRTIDAEVQAALEIAFPPESIDVNVLSAFLESLIGVSAPDGDREYLADINNALAKAKRPWTASAGWDGEVRFYPYASPSQKEGRDKDDDSPEV